MGVTITFNYVEWKAAYPQFAYLTEPQAVNYFNMATMVHCNDGGGPVTDAQQQTNLLWLLTAHVAQLFAPSPSGQPSSGLVGRISQAAEGSVNVSVELVQLSQNAAWFTQTQYGLMYWTATAPFRTMRYVPNDKQPIGSYGTAPGFGYGYTGFNDNGGRY